MTPPTTPPRPRSLQRRLSRTLAALILVASLVAGAASFMLAYRDAQELQDDTLRQLAALAGRSEMRHPPTDSDVPVHDPESRVVVTSLAGGPRPAWLPDDLSVGFHDLPGPTQSWRVFLQDSPPRGRVAVAQSTEVRDEIAMNSAIRTLVPLVLILPVVIWLISWTVRHELAVVRKLAHIVDQQPAEQPQPIALVSLPAEIGPFVHAINRLLARVARLMDEQRRFVAVAAHELRTPLTALSLQAQNVERAASPDAARERMILLRAGIERAQHLTDQLLSLARSQSLAGRTQPIRVSALVRGLVAEYLPLAEARGVDLGIGRCDDALIIESDPQLVSSALRNAVDNAVRYTLASGEVTIDSFAEGNDCVIEIGDTGPGIPADQRERVFEPFERLDSSPTIGSGLGLAIARDAAARAGATVSLHDRPGGGLLFRYRQGRVPCDGPATG